MLAFSPKPIQNGKRNKKKRTKKINRNDLLWQYVFIVANFYFDYLEIANKKDICKFANNICPIVENYFCFYHGNG